MTLKFLFRIAAAAAAFTLPVLAVSAAPLGGPLGGQPSGLIAASAPREPVAPGAQDLAQPGPPADLPWYQRPAIQQGLILDNSRGNASGALPVFTLQQGSVGIDFFMQQIDTPPHTAEVGAGLMLTLQPGSPGSPAS